MRYIRCLCGKSDGHDDIVLDRELKEFEFDGSLCVVQERRRCDICGKVYIVNMHYRFVYEEKEEAEHGMIHFKNGSVIEIIESNDNMRGKRALIQPFQDADGTVDYCFNHELLDEVLAPFKKEAKDTFDTEM